MTLERADGDARVGKGAISSKDIVEVRDCCISESPLAITNEKGPSFEG